MARHSRRQNGSTSNANIQLLSPIIIFILISKYFALSDETAKLEPTSKPKDFAFSPRGSRVSRLINLFETLSDEANIYGTRSRDVISLIEAASKLHLLADGQRLEAKCNKYVRLIEQPNIRDFDSVRLLMREDGKFSDVEQPDANLLSRLINERSFDALSKLQTILQSLESEKTNGKSSYDANVRRDLLDCMSYFIYRHQRATVGLVGFIRHMNDELESDSSVNDKPDAIHKFHQSIDRIKSIESQKPESRADWIRELSKLQDLVIENRFELPLVVENFFNNQTRLEKLHSCDTILNRADDLKKQILNYESHHAADKQTNHQYSDWLMELNSLMRMNRDLFSDVSVRFIQEPSRWQLIQDELDRQHNKKMKAFQKKSPHILGSNSEHDNDSRIGDRQVAPSEIKPVNEESDDEYCRKLMLETSDDLRAFNSISPIFGRNLKIGEKLEKVKNQCLSKGANSKLNSWPIVSFKKKLSTFYTNQSKLDHHQPPSQPTSQPTSDGTSMKKLMGMFSKRKHNNRNGSR